MRKIHLEGSHSLVDRQEAGNWKSYKDRGLYFCSSILTLTLEIPWIKEPSVRQKVNEQYTQNTMAPKNQRPTFKASFEWIRKLFFLHFPPSKSRGLIFCESHLLFEADIWIQWFGNHFYLIKSVKKWLWIWFKSIIFLEPIWAELPQF